jgi:replication initiation protein RepC
MFDTEIPESPTVTTSALSCSGFRRLSPEMLAARSLADAFEGVVAGTAKPLTYLSAFQEALPYLGLPAKAGDLIAWLVKKTKPFDWEKGSRPIAWPSAREQQEYLQLSPARVKTLNRALYEAGIFVMRDDPQGKRYGRRGPDKRIIEGYGFDLSLLATRHEEFVRLAAEAQVERTHAKALRKRKTIARRAVYQAGETLAGLGPMPEGWPALATETARLVRLPGGTCQELMPVVEALETCQAKAEAWVRDATKSVETIPEGLENKPHNTNTNLISNLKNTVVAIQNSSPAEAVPSTSDSEPTSPPDTKASGITAPQLLELAPRLQAYLKPGADVTWREIIDAAYWLSGELKISRSAWEEACRDAGRERAAIMVALVSAKDPAYFIKGPAHYFAGMVRKGQKEGQLNLVGSIWALRQKLWGGPRKGTLH